MKLLLTTIAAVVLVGWGVVFIDLKLASASNISE